MRMEYNHLTKYFIDLIQSGAGVFVRTKANNIKSTPWKIATLVLLWNYRSI